MSKKRGSYHKLWLAQLGSERIDEVFDPEIAIKRAIVYYRKRGYDDRWIEARIKATLDRNKLTDIWKSGGIKESSEYAILTNEIYKEWSGMTANEYKNFKGIRKESLRDNMTDIEIALTDLAELTTRHIAEKEKPNGLLENKNAAIRGGSVAKKTKDFYEETTGLTAISKSNSLNYQYIDDSKLIDK